MIFSQRTSVQRKSNTIKIPEQASSVLLYTVKKQKPAVLPDVAIKSYQTN
jgi:hypothetical protein